MARAMRTMFPSRKAAISGMLEAAGGLCSDTTSNNSKKDRNMSMPENKHGFVFAIDHYRIGNWKMSRAGLFVFCIPWVTLLNTSAGMKKMRRLSRDTRTAGATIR